MSKSEFDVDGATCMSSHLNECDEIISEKKRLLLSLLEELDPLEIMIASVWRARFVGISAFRNSQIEVDSDPFNDVYRNKMNLIPEYLQSCLVTCGAYGCTSHEHDSAPDCFTQMLSCAEFIIDTMYRTMPIRYLSQYVTDEDDGASDGFLDYQIEAKFYQSVRGVRYQAIEEEYLTILLARQDELIRSVYGIGSTEVVEGVSALIRSLTLGWVEDLDRVVTRYQDMSNQDVGMPDSSSSGLEIDKDRLYGCRLNDVFLTTQWPGVLICDLSLPVACSRDCEAFEALDPLGILPIVKKPFLQIGERSYCFCPANLLDNFYRAFYQAIKSRYQKAGLGTTANFATIWKDNQASASEEGVAAIIKSILPEAKICANCYIPSKGIKWDKRRFEEHDLVVIYEDVLIVIEVKAGAFCPTDPIEDLRGHIKSFENLLESASRQASSVVNYIERCEGGPCRLYDARGRVELEFPSSLVRSIFKICVTVDDFGEFASKADKLSFIEMANGTIALSIDDLLVYKRYFDNPLRFLHYLEQRRAAACMPALYLNDELDNLGLYINYNRYPEVLSREAKETKPDYENDHRFRIQGFLGFRTHIDAWFDNLYAGEESDKPIQSSFLMFDCLVELLNDVNLGYWRRPAANTLLNCDFKQREMISDGIQSRLNPSAPLNWVIELFSRKPGNIPLSIFVNREEHPNDDKACKEKCIATLVFDNVPFVIRLDIEASKGRIDALRLTEYRLEDLTDDEKREASYHFDLKKRLRASCMRKMYGKKIGRNDPCPCGSGKKYKKCCGR